jgi:prefoldin subunit 5
MDEIHQWHNVQDEDGVKIWYVRRSFYESIERHNEELHKLTAILTELVHEQRGVAQTLKTLETKAEKAHDKVMGAP